MSGAVISSGGKPQNAGAKKLHFISLLLMGAITIGFLVGYPLTTWISLTFFHDPTDGTTFLTQFMLLNQLGSLSLGSLYLLPAAVIFWAIALFYRIGAIPTGSTAAPIIVGILSAIVVYIPWGFISFFLSMYYMAHWNRVLGIPL